MAKRSKFTPEFKNEAAEMVVNSSMPITTVAKQLGVVEQTLGNWVRQYREEHAADDPALSVSERARLKELERENRQIRMENEFLKKAAAYFAQDPR